MINPRRGIIGSKVTFIFKLLLHFPKFLSLKLYQLTISRAACENAYLLHPYQDQVLPALKCVTDAGHPRLSCGWFRTAIPLPAPVSLHILPSVVLLTHASDHATFLSYHPQPTEWTWMSFELLPVLSHLSLWDPLYYLVTCPYTPDGEFIYIFRSHSCPPRSPLALVSVPSQPVAFQSLHMQLNQVSTLPLGQANCLLPHPGWATGLFPIWTAQTRVWH